MDRHIILTRGRSGSNNLVNTLNMHPEIINYGEVFGDWTPSYRLYRRSRWIHRRSIDDYLDFIFSSPAFYFLGQAYSAFERARKRTNTNFKRRGNIKSFGIKDFFHVIQKRGAMEYFSERPDIAIIYLYRENVLRRYLSFQFLARTGVAWMKKGSSVQRDKLTIDRDDLFESLDRFTRYLREERETLDKLSSHRILTIRFEDYFASPQATADYRRQAFEFLGVEPITQGSGHQKMSPRSIADMVHNHDELLDWLHGTKYEQFFD